MKKIINQQNAQFNFWINLLLLKIQKLICAICWFILFFVIENARSKKQNHILDFTVICPKIPQEQLV